MYGIEMIRATIKSNNLDSTTLFNLVLLASVQENITFQVNLPW